MSNFRDEIRRKKQAEEREKRRQEDEESKHKKQEEEEWNKRLKEHDDFSHEIEEILRKRKEFFNRIDPWVTEVLKILGCERWGLSSYKIERKDSEYWILSHYL